MIHQSGFNPPARLRSADHTQRSMPALGVGWCATPSYLALSLAHIGRALTSCLTQRSRGASSKAWRGERALQLSSCLLTAARAAQAVSLGRSSDELLLEFCARRTRLLLRHWDSPSQRVPWKRQPMGIDDFPDVSFRRDFGFEKVTCSSS